MGFWDWATTAREGLQTAGGDVGSYITHGFQGARKGLAAPENAPIKATIGGTPTGFKMPSTPQSGSTPAPTTPAPVTPAVAAGGQVYFNPLASSMYASQLLAPLFTNLANQFHAWNQQAAGTPNPMAQYLSPDQRAAAGQQMAQISAGNDQVSAALIGAALASPQIDALQQSMNTLSQRALQSYTEALKTGQTQNIAAGNIFAANPNLQTAAAGGLTTGSGTIKQTAQSRTQLPNTGNQTGDLAYVADENATYQWDGTAWTKTG